jgi:hypothetical protein
MGFPHALSSMPTTTNKRGCLAVSLVTTACSRATTHTTTHRVQLQLDASMLDIQATDLPRLDSRNQGSLRRIRFLPRSGLFPLFCLASSLLTAKSLPLKTPVAQTTQTRNPNTARSNSLVAIANKDGRLLGYCPLRSLRSSSSS